MCHVPPDKVHFCTPAVASVAASATLPLTAGVTKVPSPSSQTYSVVAFANQIPNGNATGVGLPVVDTPLASTVGNPGSTVMGTVARVAVSPLGRTPGLPT